MLIGVVGLNLYMISAYDYSDDLEAIGDMQRRVIRVVSNSIIVCRTVRLVGNSAMVTAWPTQLFNACLKFSFNA